MKLLAVHTFPVWSDTTPQEAWQMCAAGGRDRYPELSGWANALIIEISGERRELLAVAA